MTDIHKNILRILLITLAITATAGVISVLMQNGIMARITGTGFVTVLGALLMLKISASLENPKIRATSLFGICAIAAEVLIITVIIWADLINVHNYGQLVSTFFVVLIWSLFTALAIRALAVEFSRIAGRVGVAFSVLTILSAMAGLWIAYDYEIEWAATAGTFGTMGLAITCCCVGLGVSVEGLPKRRWRWIGIVSGAIAIILGMVEIWHSRTDINEAPFSKYNAVIALIAMYTAFASLCVLTPLKSNQRWLLHGTLGAGLVLAILIALMAFEVGDLMMVRYAGATAIPTACGAVALAVVARMNKRDEFEVSSHDYMLIQVTCPRCRTAQQLKPGKSRCACCLLKFEINVEEPRCPNCDYLLYMLEGKECPECGTKIALSDQPATPTPVDLPPTPNMPPLPLRHARDQDAG